MFDLVSSIIKKGENTMPKIQFLKDRNSILKAISNSAETGKLLGVYSKVLGEGMFLTGVDNIENDGRGKVVVFETYDLSGQILGRTRVDLEDIKTVCPFDIQYVNPLIGAKPKTLSKPMLLNLW
jgi:hypothetical protein